MKTITARAVIVFLFTDVTFCLKRRTQIRINTYFCTICHTYIIRSKKPQQHHMKYGFTKVAAATPQTTVADCHKNAESIIAQVKELEEKESELILFPELSLTSCSCGDLFTQPHMTQSCNKALAHIANETALCNAIIVVGAPIEHRNALYNCAVVIHKGEIIGITPKRYLNNRERRWFADAETLPADSFVTINGYKAPFVKNGGLFSTKSYSFGIEIGSEAAAPASPGAEQAVAGAHIILNPIAEHAVAGMQKSNKRCIAERSARYKSAYVYAGIGWGESTSSAAYPGYCAIAECGELLAECGYLKQTPHYVITEVDVERISAERKGDSGFTCPAQIKEICIQQAENSCCNLTRKFSAQPFIPQDYTIEEYCNEAFDIQAAALAKRLTHTCAKSCVIGVSGGLDSTLALLVVARACDIIGMPRESITSVTMPGFGTSGRTYRNAIALMEALGTRIREISIKDACIQHFKDIDHDLNNHDVTYENAQARERTQILMDIANQEGGIVIGTGDLSELALGWATYNGDQMSMYSVNASVPKTLMQHMVRNFAACETNEKVKETLLDIVGTPISPELTPADEKGNIKQKTEDLVGPYELHDFFIYHFTRYGFAPEKIYMMAEATFGNSYNKEEIKKWLTTFMRRFFTQQFKRSAMPDGPQVTCCTLSPQYGWVMTADTCHTMWTDNCNEIK